MLSKGFPDVAWVSVLKRLRPSDIKSLRLSCKFIRTCTYEFRTPNRKEVGAIINKTYLARQLLTTVYVPRAFRMSLPDNAFEAVAMPDYVEPSAWKISSMTMLSYLSTPVNLRSVFHCIEAVDFNDMTMEQRELFVESRLQNGHQSDEQSMCISQSEIQTCADNNCECLGVFFPGVLDIHYQDFCRGNPEFAEVKAKKREKPSAKTFGNQCTMRVCMSHSSDSKKNGQEWDIINMKVFQNGKIQMTGCQSLEQARAAVQFVLDKLMDKAPIMRAKSDCMTQIRCTAGEVLKNHVKMPDTDVCVLHVLPRDVLTLVLLNVHNETLFACRKTCKIFHEILESPDFWTQKCVKELCCTVRRHETKGWFIKEKYSKRFNRMEPVKKPDFFLHPRLMYCDNRLLRRHKPFIVVEKFERVFVAREQIVMMNTDFKTNFSLNLPALFKILRREYKLRAEYNPDGYVGINVKYVIFPITTPFLTQLNRYISPIIVEMVNDDGTISQEEITISFFIFGTGSVIINSARSIDQQQEAFEYLNAIFRTHYRRIWKSSK